MRTAEHHADKTADRSFLDGGGELGALMRRHDWSRTPLGPPESWPRSLKTAVRILLTSRQPFWLGWGPELTYLYNDPYQSIIGGKHPAALGRPFREVWSEIWDVVGPMADTVMNRDQGTYVEAQLLIMQRHGYQEETYYTFSYSPIPNDDGTPGGLICANTDDTRRVLGERQLATLRELAERIAEAKTPRQACERAIAALATNQWDLPFALTYLSEVPGEAPALAASSPGTEALTCVDLWPWLDVIETGEARLVELGDSHGKVPSGAWPRPPTHAAAIPIGAAATAGAGAGILILGLNPFRRFDESFRGFLELISRQLGAGVENAQAYEEQRRRAEALAELDRAKTAFFNNVSHEFRTPLTLMLGPLDDTLASPELSGAARQRVEVARRSALRLMKLVNTLLDFSRIEAGRIHASYEPVELGAFTAELASMFRSTLERAGIALIIECADLGEPVHVDREMWEKILFNLLSNAFKFTFEGEIEVRLRRSDRDAILVVRDTGVGIPEDERSHVFERFHRIRGAQGRSFEGTGIGLSLVRELVKLHGGSIAMESVVGVGTTFTVTVPLGTAHLPEDRIGAHHPAPPSTRGDAYVQEVQSWLPDEAGRTIATASPIATARVLVADDNGDMRGYLERILGAHFLVEAFADGEAALARAREVLPDLVITDVMMPRLDGFGLMRELRRDPRLEHVPVILLSARAGEEARVEGVAAGADDYLVKPFSARELLARAHALIEVARLRAELRRDGERYRHIFESAAVSIWQEDFSRVKVALDDILRSGVTDLREYLTSRPELVRELIESVEIRDVNAETLRLFGAEHKRDLLASLHEIFVPETVPVFIEELVAIAEGRSPFEAEAVVRTRSGERRDVLVKLAFSPADSRLESVLVTLMDVTARKQAERALREDDRRKDEFLAMLSHELRNPMAPLANGIHLLRLGAHQGSATRVLEVMERQVNHLVRLVDDLLEMSRISRGIVELQKERVRLDAVVKNAIETSTPLIQAAGHQLSLELPEEPLWIEGDPVRLGQVLSNVLNNAARYTPAGGRIALRAERRDGSVCIAVQDNGSGIDDQTMPHIFEMFVRGRGASEAGKAGLGIGLALAQTLTELHGGTIEAASAGPGRGSEFTIRLPLASPPAAAAGAEARSENGASSVRVLVVDDNQDAAETLAELLSELGANVRVANDGRRALADFAHFDPALVLLDIGMPGMDGYEVAHRLRVDFPERAPVVVALTGWGQSSDRERARAAGFDRHLVKPAGLSDLRRLLTSIPPRDASAELQ